LLGERAAAGSDHAPNLVAGEATTTKGKNMSTFNIEQVGWSEPRVVQTIRGLRQIRTWKPPPGHPFWEVWSTGTLKQQGYSVSKWKDEWQVTEWREVSGAQPADVQRAVDAANRSDDVARRNEQADPELPPVLAARFSEVERIYNEIFEETGNDYRFQLPSIKRLALSCEAFDGGLDASDTGIGKTPVACAVAKTLGRKLFVICPLGVLPPWERMAKRFDVDIWAINYEMLRTGNTHYGWWDENKKRKFIYDLDPDEVLFVFDECHRMKDDSTLNAGLGLSAIEDGYKVLALSATAADNPMHMKFIGLLTGLFRHPSHFYGWMTQNGVRRGKWGLEFVGGRDVLSRIHRQIFPVRGSRIRIADLGERFPQTTIISEAYQMNGAADQIQAVYDTMAAEIAKLERRKASDRGASILTAILRARQEVELLKVPTLVQMAQDGLAEGMSVVVILNFEDTVQAVAQRLRCDCIIHGDQDRQIRQQIIDDFNADDEHTLIMNIKAGGLGISLQGSHNGRHRLVLISPTFSGIDLKQALGRCWRAGGATSIQKIVWAADTIEERTCEKVRSRIKRIDTLNDGELSSEDWAIPVNGGFMRAERTRKPKRNNGRRSK
jgi:superfamily II DNA or RNA helicase